MTFNRVVHGRHGQFIVNVHDDYVGKSLVEFGEFSKGEADLFQAIIDPSWHVIEVGANIGAHTVQLAKLAKRVTAFEPQRIAFQALCGTIALNGLTNVWAYQAACGIQTGVTECPYLDPTAQGNFGGVSLCDRFVGPVESVPIVRLDTQEPCDFLKLDCEGMELSVLNGIGTQRPVLYLEIERPAQQQTIPQWLLAAKYECWWHMPPLYAMDNYRQNAENPFGGLCSINLLCVPAERPLAFDPAGFDMLPMSHWQVCTKPSPSARESAPDKDLVLT